MTGPHQTTLRGKRLLLTGGAGFIGSQLARRLVEHNEVVIFDNGHRNALRYTDVAAHPNLRVVEGDVLDRGALQEAMRGSQLVLHLASIAGVDTVMKMPTKTMRVNLLGTMNALDAAVELGGVERFVDFSTSEVFGSYVYKAEEHSATTLGIVGESRWTYAVSKLAAEHLAHSYHREHGLPTVSVRPFNVYGPQQVGIGAIHVFVVNALKGDDLVVLGDGNQIRSWCYVDDMVDGILYALENPAAVGHVFNIGNPRATLTIAHLAETVVRVTGSKSKIRFEPAEHEDVELRIPSIGKAARLLGYEPRVDLEEGLRRTIEWYRERLVEEGALSRSSSTGGDR